MVIALAGDFAVLRHGGSVRCILLVNCRPSSSVLGPGALGELDVVNNAPGAAGLLEGLLDEAGNDLAVDVVVDLGRWECERARADVVSHEVRRDPVMTRSRARSALLALACSPGDGVQQVWGHYASVTPDETSRGVFLSLCCAVGRSARKGMREVTPDRAASLDFQLAKQKELALWDA